MAASRGERYGYTKSRKVQIQTENPVSGGLQHLPGVRRRPPRPPENLPPRPPPPGHHPDRRRYRVRRRRRCRNRDRSEYSQTALPGRKEGVRRDRTTQVDGGSTRAEEVTDLPCTRIPPACTRTGRRGFSS